MVAVGYLNNPSRPILRPPGSAVKLGAPNNTTAPNIAPASPAVTINHATPSIIGSTSMGTAGNIGNAVVGMAGQIRNTAVGTAGQVAPSSMLQQNTLGTVQGRTASIIDQNSPLMRRAAAKALIQANSRGMLNSSMAIGSAQNAVLQAAAPIAANDAASYNDFAKTNQAATNAVNTTNAGFNQQANLAAASAQNATAGKNASFIQQANLTNAQEANRVSLANAQEANRVSLANAQEANKTARLNVAARNAVVMANLAQANKITAMNVAAKHDITAAKLDQANKIKVIDITAKYKNQMQSNITSAGLYTTTMNAISKMQANKDMTPKTRKKNIDHALAFLTSGLKVAGSIARLDLTSTINGYIGVNP